MKILGFQTGHDVAYSILENGIPLIHEELERFTRQKEPLGDGLKMAFDYSDFDLFEIKHFTLGNYGMYQEKGIKGLIPIAYASGAMLIRGYERGERVYLSMISRGFNGSIELKKREYDNSVLLIFVTLISIFVLILDKYL